MKTKLIISGEHVSAAIPVDFKPYFLDQQEVLLSHRGVDIGSDELFNTLVERLKPDYSIKADYSRLLVELNRSLHHPKLFSEFTKKISKREKDQIIEKYYLPYRSTLENVIANYLNQNYTVLHLSIHSFTPTLNNVIRTADIGLLYDPKHKAEKEFSKRYKARLKSLLPDFSVRYNYPYLGTADGFTTYLRKQFPSNYAGIEIELNNKWAASERYSAVQEQLAQGIRNSLTR